LHQEFNRSLPDYPGTEFSNAVILAEKQGAFDGLDLEGYGKMLEKIGESLIDRNMSTNIHVAEEGALP
jgi:hypothetical protein